MVRYWVRHRLASGQRAVGFNLHIEWEGAEQAGVDGEGNGRDVVVTNTGIRFQQALFHVILPEAGRGRCQKTSGRAVRLLYLMELGLADGNLISNVQSHLRHEGHPQE